MFNCWDDSCVFCAEKRQEGFCRAWTYYNSYNSWFSIRSLLCFYAAGLMRSSYAVALKLIQE